MADDDSKRIELREGRPEPVQPYTRLGDWVVLTMKAKKIRPPAVPLYWALCMHLNNQREKEGDREVWPTQDALAEMLGYSEGKKIAPYLTDLVSIGAIEIGKEPDGGFRERSYYVIHKSPPPDHEGPESIGDFYAERNARLKAERAARRQAERQENAQQLEPAAKKSTPKKRAATKRVPEKESAGESAATDQGAENGTNHPTEPESPWAQMSPWPVGPNEPMAVGPNEPINKKKQQDEVNENGGADRRPPAPPSDLTAGHVDQLVTSITELVGNPQTARTESGVLASNSQADTEIPVREAVMAEVRSKYPSKVRPRSPWGSHCPVEPPELIPATTSRAG